MIISKLNEQPKKGAPAGTPFFYFLRYTLCDQLSTRINFITQTFAAVVVRVRFAVNEAFRLRATLFTAVIFDYMDCLSYF